MKLKFIATVFCTGIISVALSQNSSSVILQSFQDNVDRAQISLQAADGKADGQFLPYYDNDKLNKESNDAATKGVDDLQDYIEQKSWDNNKKIKYLRGLVGLLNNYKTLFIGRSVTGAQLVNTLKAYKQAMDLDGKGDDITPVIEKYQYQVSYLLSINDALQSNPGKANFDAILLSKDLSENPSQSLNILNGILKKNGSYAGTDSILHKLAIDSSDAIYTWASAYQPLGEYIRKSADPLVSTISKIANAQGSDGSKTGRQYMPFLDDLYRGKITMDQIDDAMGSDVKYFKLLVNTEVSYSLRMAQRDTALARDVIQNKIRDVATDDFINIVNGLHEKSNEERYACLKPLNAVDLYYLIVAPIDDVIYTSTYVNGKDYGLYRMIWQKGGKELTADSLMVAVGFDYFKKWIKMAANYNTLDDFLGKMQPDDAQTIMKAFVRHLDKPSSKDSLEDAVNVAASYSSIDDPKIKQLVLDEVQSNLSQAKRIHNKKAYNIYYILNTLFLSMDTTNNIDLSAQLGIEPVYFLPINKLKDSSGRIVIQQFTYGDEDGAVNYERFMDAFSKNGWKESSNKFWSTVSSTSGTPITIYTNRPLGTNSDPSDDDAQNALNDYLDENDIHPTLAFHRGHSYWLKTSIKQLHASEKLVFLGSCGGFQSLNDILKAAPSAQIISTKQTGAGDLNLPMIQRIILELQKGRDLNWVRMWKEFSKQLSSDNRFADYVPPYENLGAVFLVAYQKLQDKEKEQADSKDISAKSN